MTSVFKPAALLMSGRAVGFVVTFAIPVVLARVFSQADFGTYKQLFLLYGTLLIIGQLGVAESLYYFLPGSPREGGRFAANALIVLVAAGLASLALLWGLRLPVAHWFGNPPLAADVPLVGGFLALALAAVVLEIVMTARKRFRAASVTYAASDCLRAVFYLTPVLLFGGLKALLWGAVAFGVVRFAATVVYLRRDFGRQLLPDGRLVRRQFAYALPFSFAVLVEVVQSNLHLYAVGYYFDAATFAVYSIGCLQIPLVDLMMTSTSSVMMVQMREHMQAGERDSVLRIWRDTTVKLGVVFLPLVGGLVALAHPLITSLFTLRYERSVPLFMVGATSILLAAVMTDSVLRVYAQTRYLIFANVVRLAFVAGSVSWFLTRYGLMGAIVVTVLAGALFKAVGLVRIRALFGCRWTQLLPWAALARTAVLTAAAAAPAVLVQRFLAAPAPVELLAGGTVYAAACAGLLYLWAPITRAERAELTALAWRPVRRLLRVARPARGPVAAVRKGSAP